MPIVKGNQAKTTTLANLGSAQSAGVSASRLVSESGIIVDNDSSVWQSTHNMKIPSSGTVALVGCSVTHMNQIGAGLYGNSRQCDFGWANWLCHYLGGFDIVSNFAVGGATTGPNAGNAPSTNNVINQLSASLSAGTDWIIGDFGILNDAMQKANLSITCGYIDDILRMLSSKNCIMINSTPLLAGGTWSTAPIMNFICQANAYLQNAVKKYKNIILIDAYSAVVDPVTGYAKAGYIQSDDYVHYLQKTCRAISAKAVSQIGSRFVIVDSKSPKSQADIYHATQNPKRAQTNPKLIGSGGTNNIGGTVTGTLPTGTTLSKAGTAINGSSAVDATNGGWTVTVTSVGAANDKLFMIPVQVADGWAAAGETVFGGFTLQMSGVSNVLSMTCQLTAVVDSVTKIISTCLEPDNTDGTHIQSSIDNSDGIFYVRIPKDVIPAGSVVSTVRLALTPVFSATAATAVFKITDAWLEKV